MNLPNSRYDHAFAVVRIDFPIDDAAPENSFTILKVFFKQSAAEAERERLSKINEGKSCRYLVIITRLEKKVESI